MPVSNRTFRTCNGDGGALVGKRIVLSFASSAWPSLKAPAEQCFERRVARILLSYPLRRVQVRAGLTERSRQVFLFVMRRRNSARHSTALLGDVLGSGDLSIPHSSEVARSDDALQTMYSGTSKTQGAREGMRATNYQEDSERTKFPSYQIPSSVVASSYQSRARERLHKVQVMTDIDDTVKSSGGLRLAGIPLGGIDTRFARGKFYPGVFQFALELATYELPPMIDPLPIAVLTARAREFKFALALNRTSPLCLEYKKAGARKGYQNWGVGHVLYGSVAEWICQGRKGLRKFQNFLLLRMRNEIRGLQRHYDVSYIYVGDTGEMDLDAGERMLRSFPQNMRAVFLHDVSPGPLRQDDCINGIPVLYFRTYIGAARKAVAHQLMGVNSMLEVVKQAEDDYVRYHGRQDCDCWKELENDAKDARKLASSMGVV